MIILYNCGGKPPYGGDRPVGETAPNAVLCGGGGTRPQRGFIWRLLRGY
jgi:hypothetical protein